jgi:TRAP-type C4-dicarboxylate transport system permease large subunit
MIPSDRLTAFLLKSSGVRPWWSPRELGFAFTLGFFVYREIKPADLPGIITESVIGTASIVIIMSAVQPFSWVLINIVMLILGGFMIMIGTITPPVGTIMYVVCALGEISIAELAREI